MQKVYKYPLDFKIKQYISMPVGADILCVQLQHGNPCIWAQGDPSETWEQRAIVIYTTGEPHPPGKMTAYIGTLLFSDGDIVVHVYEEL